jgi:hypothetical protein
VPLESIRCAPKCLNIDLRLPLDRNVFAQSHFIGAIDDIIVQCRDDIHKLSLFLFRHLELIENISEMISDYLEVTFRYTQTIGRVCR